MNNTPRQHDAHGDVDAREAVLEMTIENILIDDQRDEQYWPVTLRTTRGDINYRLYHAVGSSKAVLLLGSVLGTWDSPVGGLLYPQLCDHFVRKGVSVLWVKYRASTNLIESILDAMAGVFFLRSQQFTSVDIIGHAFGGAVALQTAAASPSVSSVTAVSTQLHGIDAVARIRPECRILFLHNLDDGLVSPLSSVIAYNRAHENKELVLFAATRRNVHEVSQTVERAIVAWVGYT